MVVNQDRGLPQHAGARAARLARLPVSLVGRAAWGWGKRLTGTPGEQVQQDLQAKAAAETFAVLGELKGGAMKVGQQLSIFEAAVPEQFAEPYREALAQLQDRAPSRPLSDLEPVLQQEWGPDWRKQFSEFEDEASAAASIGQVHRARWSDGREVAVKIQYPEAEAALTSDLRQLSRLARVIAPLLPGMELAPFVAELQDRMVEELDYRREAWSQQVFADIYAEDPEVVVPQVVAHGRRVLVSEWIEGTPLNRLIAEGDTSALTPIAPRYLEFLLSGPHRAGLLHADPHPGNFRITPDGRLGVLDFGAVDRLPEGLPPQMGRLLSVALRADADSLEDGLRDEGFIRDSVQIDPADLAGFLEPLVAPCRTERFEFTRDWMRGVAGQIHDPRQGGLHVALRLNLPPQYVLIHRVWLGGTAVLCQMGVQVPTRAVVSRYLPELVLPEISTDT